MEAQHPLRAADDDALAGAIELARRFLDNVETVVHGKRDRIELVWLREALRLERKVEILYQVPDRPPERRVVWPIVLAFFEHARVLAAWCELRQSYRNFRTDRMLEMTVLEARPPRGRKRLYAEWRRYRMEEARARDAEPANEDAAGCRAAG